MVKNPKQALLFIFITLLLDVIGFGIIIPVMPKLLSDLTHHPVTEVSQYGGYLMSVFAIAQFIFSPIMGSLSDQFGRRPILLISLLGFGIDYLILAFAPSYSWLFIGRIIAGITGASFTTASAFISDISTNETRTKNFGMIGAAFGLGFIIGPALGGLLGKMGPRIPFFVTAALSLLNFLYGYFVLPESLDKENRRKFDWKRANPVGTLVQLFKYKELGILIIAFIFLYLGGHAVQSNWTFFTIYRFQWDEFTIGLSLALVGLLVAIIQAGLAHKIGKIYGNERSVYIGFAFYTIGMFLFAFANQSWMMFAFLIPYCIGGIAMPNLQSLMATFVPKNAQGELQGGLTSLVSLTTIFGPTMMTSLFSYFTSNKAPFIFPGAPFFLGGIFMLISFVITYLLLRNRKPFTIENESNSI